MNKLANSKKLLCLPGKLFLLAVTGFMLIGCKTANYGTYRVNPEVDKLFVSGQVLADHKYYYSGSNARPDAVMGIQKNYTLDEEFWSKADDVQKNLKYWAEQINKNLKASGYYILAPDGKKIGIFYSSWSTGPVQMEGNNRVIVYLPDKESDTRTMRMGKE